MIFILLAILGALSAWEEVQQLIQRTSWKIKDYRVPIWGTEWKGFKRLFNSHHFVFGLFVLVMLELVFSRWVYYGALPFNYDTLYFMRWWGSSFWTAQIEIVIYWFFFFWQRNIWMHIVFKKKPLWEYLWRKI